MASRGWAGAALSGNARDRRAVGTKVTTLGFIGSGDIGSPLGRRGLAVVGDDPDAVAAVAAQVDSFGFDPPAVTPLAEDWRIQRDTPGYGPRLTLDGLRDASARAVRYREP